MVYSYTLTHNNADKPPSSCPDPLTPREQSPETSKANSLAEAASREAEAAPQVVDSAELVSYFALISILTKCYLAGGGRGGFQSGGRGGGFSGGRGGFSGGRGGFRGGRGGY